MNTKVKEVVKDTAEVVKACATLYLLTTGLIIYGAGELVTDVGGFIINAVTKEKKESND